MAWEDKMVPMLRVLINDLGKDPTYSQRRLEEVICVASHFVCHEIDFDTTYTTTIGSAAPHISPDPTLTASRDDEFVNFCLLKAACFLDWSQYRTEALRAGIEARLGPAVLRTMDRLKGFSELVNKGPCAAYQALKEEHEFGNANVCKAILSPFIGNEFDPDSLSNISSNTREMYR